ncbi:hypothetical protein acdb102_42760 [Acidothermaceae bacterium B102]|nr:hypothetical protein acdb102_42760 [Acidothermaceae bacterium B102]
MPLHDQTMIIAAAEPTVARDGRATATYGAHVPLRAPAGEGAPGVAAPSSAGPLRAISRAALAAVVDVGSARAARGWREAALAALAGVAHPLSDTAGARPPARGTAQVGTKVRQEATRASARRTAGRDDEVVETVAAAGGAQ